MARIKRGVNAHRRHKKILRLARGYRGGRSKLFRPANETVLRALAYARHGRRQRKRDFRRLWIARINAATRQGGLSYSRFMAGLRKEGIVVNRKMLADLAVRDSVTFQALVARAKEGLAR